MMWWFKSYKVCSYCGCLVEKRHIRTAREVTIGSYTSADGLQEYTKYYCKACRPPYDVTVSIPCCKTRYYKSFFTSGLQEVDIHGNQIIS